MHFSSIVLVAVVYALIASEALTATSNSDQTKIAIPYDPSTATSHDFIDDSRLLRAEKTTEVGDSLNDDNAATDANDAEERGIASSIAKQFSALKTKVSNSVKTSFWVELEKSDDAVKQKLGLTGLTGAKLTSHPKYPVYQKFVYKVEGKMLNQMFERGKSTTTLWKELGLRTDDLSPEAFAALKKTPEFKTYMRYAEKYDSWTHSFRNGIFEPPRHIGGVPGELWAKAEMWATAGRSKGYVKEMLGLDVVSKASLSSHPFYKYYAEFLRLAHKTK